MTALGIGATATIVIAGLLLIAALFTGISQSERSQTCMDEAMREHVRAIVLAALDRALTEHTVRVLNVRLSDRSGTPERAMSGVQIGIDAYVRNKRAMIAWSPPTC